MANTSTKRPAKASSKPSMVDWWFGTVLFTFFPTILAAIIDLCSKGAIDFPRLIGDGELVLCAYLVATPTLINLYNTRAVSNGGKVLFYLLLIAASLQMVVYSVFKTNTSNIESVVYVCSGICIVVSIFVAWLGQRHLRRVS